MIASIGAEIVPRDVIDFWIDAGPERWFKKDDAFDAEIGRRFGAAAEDATTGALDDWAATPEGTLALVLVLDQFRRNIHRGTPEAFSADPKALSIAQDALARGDDRRLPAEHRVWLYLPFEHAEDLEAQQVCMERTAALCAELGDNDLLKYAAEHRDIIARFGRFPHRNAILGRTSTPKEQRFLDDGGFAG